MASPSHTRASPDLQNSYGPEMAASEHQSGYGPQSVPADGGLEAIPGQQTAAPVYSSYAQQAEKNGTQPEATLPAPRRRRFLGLPLWGLWFLIGMAIVVLGVALGAGLGVGLSQRSTTSASSNASATSSASSSTTAPATATTATTATPTTSIASTTTSSTTTSSTSAAATNASVEICQNAYLDSCTTISVPADSCINFPASYNDAVSSVDTGGPVCLFYTDTSCTGDYWSTNGTQDLIPGDFNDAFSSVTCD